MSAWIHDMVKPGEAPIRKRIARFLARKWVLMGNASVPDYQSPTVDELAQIEAQLITAGIPIGSLYVNANDYIEFKRKFVFPADYYGGPDVSVYEEKLLEHYIAFRLIDIGKPTRMPYLDVAACASPWAKLLRDNDIQAFSIDLEPTGPYAGLPFYEKQDATATNFESGSIGSASLQCAFEMFIGDSDTKLIIELARILRVGGRAVISPLYMHTHACHYQSPDFTGRIKGDLGAVIYVRRDIWGIPSSRKYSAATLIERVLEPAGRHGLIASLHAVRNAREIHPKAYMHFVLVLDKPDIDRESE
jgi:hypothetical protein